MNDESDDAETKTPVKPEVETPEDEPVEQPKQSDDDDSGNGEDAEAAQKPHKNKVSAKKRIKELTRDFREEQRQREALQRERDYFRDQATKGQQEPAQAQDQPQGKPTLQQFNYDQEQYLEALATYKATEVLEARDKTAAETVKRETEAKQAQAFQIKIADYDERNPGAWQQMVNAPITTTPAMLEYTREADKGLDVMHYLTQHLEEARSISQMSPYQTTRAMETIAGKLEPSELEDDTDDDEPELPAFAQPKPVQTKRVTRASEPPHTIDSRSPPRKPLEKWTIADHIAAVRRNKR